VARDLAPQGYAVTVFDGEPKAGGFMRTQIPRFRLPESGDRRGGRLHPGLGVEFARPAHRLDEGPAGRGLRRGVRRLRRAARARPGHARPQEAAAHIHIGIDWLASVSFGHITSVGKRVIVLGGGNTAMDCCRSARRLGADDVKVIVRSGFEEMKASPWEKEDAQHEGIPILNFHVPKAFITKAASWWA
jgi:formate dehydrogenase beta subunit